MAGPPSLGLWPRSFRFDRDELEALDLAAEKGTETKTDIVRRALRAELADELAVIRKRRGEQAKVAGATKARPVPDATPSASLPQIPESVAKLLKERNGSGA